MERPSHEGALDMPEFLCYNIVKGGVYTERLRDEVNDGLGDIKAIPWYQGCTDAEKTETAVIYENEFMNYRNEMKKMLLLWC